MFLQRASVRSTSAPRFKVSLRHSADDDPSSWGANPCDPHSPPKKGKRAKTDWAKTPHFFYIYMGTHSRRVEVRTKKWIMRYYIRYFKSAGPFHGSVDDALLQELMVVDNPLRLSLMVWGPTLKCGNGSCHDFPTWIRGWHGMEFIREHPLANYFDLSVRIEVVFSMLFSCSSNISMLLCAFDA